MDVNWKEGEDMESGVREEEELVELEELEEFECGLIEEEADANTEADAVDEGERASLRAEDRSVEGKELEEEDEAARSEGVFGCVIACEGNLMCREDDGQ